MPGFIDQCRGRYRAAGFGEPEKSEVDSWRNSWPPLLRALVRAGLEDLWIYLEFGTPEGNSRFDALLLGSTDTGELAAVVVELKQWTQATVLSHDRVHVRQGGMVRTHPVAQVAGYTAFLRHWFSSSELSLDVRGLVFLHNADEKDVAPLRGLSPTGYGCPVLSRELVSGTSDGEALREIFRCSDVRAVSESQLRAFETSSWRPNRELLSLVADAIRRNPSFVLIGDQQDAFLQIKAKVDDALASGRQSVILVSGGPGSGKTALAMRLLGTYMGETEEGARYGTPSGTLRRNVRLAAGVPGSSRLFDLPRGVLKGATLVILDEAHRLRRSSGDFGTYVRKNLANVPVVVVFLDERQRIRPTEGLGAWEVHRLGEDSRIDVVSHELRGSFRCNGSRAFSAWVDALLYDQPYAWSAPDYDLGVVHNPSEMERWLEECLRQERRARISAGFCWSWETVEEGQRFPGVRIEWQDPHTGGVHLWRRPWNLHDEVFGEEGEVVAPHNQLWATQAGGEHQIGCVYTAQGLEYDDAGVIFGPDLVRRGDRWEARPEESRDGAMRGVDAKEYLDLARNTYRVLMTRGMGSCRLYSTDGETQRFLTSLIPQTVD
ncbi:DNA/RNA helicase domain-containing protein [Nocardiopsis sp. NPDC058631]|uniref:DNA/RNA helicase domain-containing protein n=1 Tax=Nocardiopsis sp. NPDC058631 TaxID=3346566 RepID=UPI003669F3CB